MIGAPGIPASPADPGSNKPAGREPPSWVLPAAVAALPLTLGFLVVAGLLRSSSSVMALMVGTFALVLLLGWWMAPATASGLVVVALASTLASLSVGATYSAFQRWVENPGKVDVSGRPVDQSGPTLRGANLRGADMRNVVLRRANLGAAKAIGANLVGADLRGSDLRGMDLTGADLSQSCLQDVDLRGATIAQTNLTGADLRGADVDGVDPGLLPPQRDQELSTAC